jgi:hypothetical protein
MKRDLVLLGSLFVLVAVLAVVHGGAAQAQQPQQGYTMNWWTVDGGGGAFSTGSGYSLGGTVGQPDAGLLGNGGYTLAGGFWCGGALATTAYTIYLPIVLRGY